MRREYKVTQTKVLEIKTIGNNSANIRWKPENYWVWLCEMGLLETLDIMVIIDKSNPMSFDVHPLT